MSQIRLFYHIVFVTKHRKDVISEQYERLLFKYIYTVCLERDVTLIRINGTPCHIHILARVPPTICISDFVRDVKRSTSLMLKRTPGFEHFEGWAREYSCDTVSFHQVDKIKTYIINQKQHHRAVDIVDELKSIFGQDFYNPRFD